MSIFKSVKILLLACVATTALVSCSDDDSTTVQGEPFVAAFENLSANLSEIEGNKDIKLVYSETASENGAITILVEATNAVYGEDFTTEPAAEGNTITLPIAEGTGENTLVFNKLNATLDETVAITFTITNVSYPGGQIQGNTAFTLNNSASLGRSLAPEVGGPNEPNQVYIDLSSEKATVVQRDTWDLGFYAGSEFQVAINGSIYMATAQLNETNIDAITQADVSDLKPLVAVGTQDSQPYVDHPDGDITKTAIDAISDTDADNKVYLVNLGYEVGTTAAEQGTVAVTGDTRGWKKIRVLKRGDDYVLQYADLSDTTHQEVTISKTRGYNFTFFSFNTNSTVSVEPEADQWDINFTLFTNLIEEYGSYGYADGVLHNRKGGVVAYAINTDELSTTYDDFSLSNLNTANFQEDQRAIGGSWREVINEDKILYDNMFYIIQDLNGNTYKLKFTALVSDQGERGYPEFKYELLQ
ncbi:HmuY family protein [uncultured Marixanthomonas sp.]|uniref:HmuY family protein n=1 Tax=uncultured Marixanthomonas sp. TaxID=757245 RepID=UPI0030D8BFCF|tara:strand:+ start:4904 stop:6319 length:1416 start_codon:yes stop_codon:yes gene_type:complete